MIEEYENVLRRLIIQLIGDEDSSPYKVSDERIKKWKENREVELKKHKGTQSENRLLFYSEFYDLKAIVSKNWEMFLPILIEKRRFEVFYEEMEKFRNTISHGRNLTSSQISLLQGITTDLKNLITIHYNKNEAKEDYFIRMSRISDNLGNSWNREPGLGAFPKPKLRVGDEYELIIEANDPRDREITYEIANLQGFRRAEESNRITFTISKEMVDPSSLFLVSVATLNSEYSNRDSMSIQLEVLPQ